MRPTNNANDNVNWHTMEDRLRKVEDALISVQTVVNLLVDLLERALPPPEYSNPDDAGGHDVPRH